MVLRDFKIVFDNPWSTYHGGQTVSGRVIVIIDSTKKIRGINIRIKGQANTSWSESKSELNNDGKYEDETQMLTGHEEYFNIQYYLLGGASGAEIELPPGEHVYPFTCILPPNLPSSFESDLGYIRYTVKATLDRPWKFDQEVKTAFTVVSPADLNQERGATVPVNEELTKTFCCLCCGSAPLNITVLLPVSGYVPGQVIPIKVNVENLSGVTVDTVKFLLRKIVTFTATVPRQATKTVKIVVSEIGKGPVEGGATVNWEERLTVPSIPPSNLNCSLIKLEYGLKVEACVSGWYHRNLKGNIPIQIGTIPLTNYQPPIAPPPGAGLKPVEYPSKPADPTYGGYPSGYPAFDPAVGHPTAPPAAPAGFVPPVSPGSDSVPAAIVPPPLPLAANLYPNLAPPSYAESSYGARNIRERGDSEYVLGARNQFAPRYPVYNFAQ